MEKFVLVVGVLHVDKIDQDVRKVASPTFEAVTAKTITADKIIGAVYE